MRRRSHRSTNTPVTLPSTICGITEAAMSPPEAIVEPVSRVHVEGQPDDQDPVPALRDERRADEAREGGVAAEQVDEHAHHHDVE